MKRSNETIITLRRDGGESPVPEARRSIRGSLLAGSAAGITSTALFHPLDLVRTKMQASLASSSVSVARGVGGTGATHSMVVSPEVAAAQKKLFRSPLAILSRTVEQGGIRSLYTGISLPIAAQAVYKATVFTVNNVTRSTIVEYRTWQQQQSQSQSQPRDGRSLKTSSTTTRNGLVGEGGEGIYRLTAAETFFCGFAGGVVNGGLFVAPVEYVRNNLIKQQYSIMAGETKTSTTTQLNGGSRSCSSVTVKPSSIRKMGPLEFIRKVVKRDGVFGLWHGAGITIIRDAIGCGAFFYTYEYTKAQMSRWSQGEDEGTYRYHNPILTIAIPGAVAGVSFWAMAMPFDTIKTLVQTKASKNMITAVFDLIDSKGSVRGLRSLFKGWQVAVGKAAPSAAVTFLTYEACFSLLEGLQ